MVKHSVALFFLFSIFSQSCCIPTMISKRSGIQACGSRLLDILNLVCGGEFYSPGQDNNIGKRQLAEQAKADVYPGWFVGVLAPRTNGILFHSTLSRRQVQGVVNECCYNQCSYSDLASYCGK